MISERKSKMTLKDLDAEIQCRRIDMLICGLIILFSTKNKMDYKKMQG